MLWDGGWSELRLEHDRRTRVKVCWRGVPGSLGERGFHQGLERRGAGWEARARPAPWERQLAQQARGTTADGAAHHFGAPQPRSISEGPMRMAETWGPFPHTFGSPRWMLLLD